MDNSSQVFLSYHSTDREPVAEIAFELRSQGIQVWFDEWELIAGEAFQPRLAAALKHSENIAVFVGPGSNGPWQSAEVQVAVNRQIAGHTVVQRVIPVLLPGGTLENVPDFLEINTLVRFASTKDPEALRRLVGAIKGRRPGPSPGEIPVAGANPYRGLEPFRFEDVRYFTGREEVVAKLLETVERYVNNRSSLLLGILGDSGTGKSSLARAGLLPALVNQSGQWRHVECKPGASPLHSLAVALLSIDGAAADILRAGEFKRRIAEDKTELAQAVGTLLSQSPGVRMALLVDQFEETFSLCADGAERAQFIAALTHAASEPEGRVLVILTLRTDFYGACAAFAEFGTILNAQHILLRPMTREELAVAIEEPALRAGYEMEPGLAAILLRDAEDQPGSLPLLQFALDELWHRRKGRQMTLDAYETLGGMSGALNHRADELFEQFTPDQQAAARRLMLRLMRIGEDGRLLRTRVPVDELCSLPQPAQADTARLVLERLSSPRSRLITIAAQASADGQSYAEVAHEALIRSWKRMAAWLDEGSAREFVVWRQRLQEWLANWRQSGESADACLRGSMLEHAVRLLQTRREDFSDSEARFIAASRDAHAAGLSGSRRRRIVQWALAAACAAAVAALAWVMTHRPGADPRIAAARSLLETNPEMAMVAALRSNLAAPSEESATILQEAFQAATAPPIEHGAPVTALSFSSDGRQIATGAKDATAALWDADRRILSPQPAGAAVLAVAAVPGALAVVSVDGVVKRWSASGGQPPATRQLGVKLLAAAFSPSGDLAAVTEENKLCLWRPAGGAPEVCRPVPPAAAVVALGGVSEPMAAVAGNSSECAVMRIRSGALTMIPLPENIVNSLSFDGSAGLLATAATAGPVRLWDTVSGAARGGAIRPNGRNVMAATLSGDGRVIATANADDSLALWSVERGSTVSLLRGPKGAVVRIALDPGGKRLAVADANGGVRLYELDPAELNRAACRHEWDVRESPDARFLADCPRYLDPRDCALDCRASLRLR